MNDIAKIEVILRYGTLWYFEYKGYSFTPKGDYINDDTFNRTLYTNHLFVNLFDEIYKILEKHGKI